jgi:hypothetical protein
MTGFFLLLAVIVLVLAVIAVLLGRLSDEDGEISSINPIWLFFAVVLFVGFCYCAFWASKWEQ